ncbi:MAG: hypothetical protein Q8Q09_28970 [Deltaproteobacteria bacterium]|nr:hypothetical protein [Deltaproteobacteria bacterium]
MASSDFFSVGAWARRCGFALTITLVACSPTGPMGDGGDVVVLPDGLVFPDVAVDARPFVEPTYRRCVVNEDCNRTLSSDGSIEICDSQFPGGMCRKLSCTTDTQCGRLGICAGAKGCLPFCDRASDSCLAYGGLCLAFAIPFEARTGCFPACNPRGPNPTSEGDRVCAMRTQCDPYVGACSSRVRTEGAENGAPCRDDGECRSAFCIPEVDSRLGMRPTGFLQGYCTSQAPLPAESVFTAARGMNLPTSTCPTGSVVIPAPMSPVGTAARCLKACMVDGDCRSGYRCDRINDGAGMPQYRNGACVPLDCSVPGAMCPAGTQCQSASGDDAGAALFTGQRCLRSTVTTDAGSDASDATSDITADATADAPGDVAGDASGDVAGDTVMDGGMDP